MVLHYGNPRRQLQVEKMHVDFEIMLIPGEGGKGMGLRRDM